MPNLLPEGTQTDISAFIDFGNVWHTDYDSAVAESNKLRSSAGFATNMYTPIGPLNFVFAQKCLFPQISALVAVQPLLRLVLQLIYEVLIIQVPP